MSRNALPASFGEDLQGILKNSCEGDYLTTGEFPLHSRGISQCKKHLAGKFDFNYKLNV